MSCAHQRRFTLLLLQEEEVSHTRLSRLCNFVSKQQNGRSTRECVENVKYIKGKVEIYCKLRTENFAGTNFCSVVHRFSSIFFITNQVISDQVISHGAKIGGNFGIYFFGTVAVF